ncbi:MAG: type II secretion system protein E [Deltaproteobacteria bacterium]|nr:type II secretion system protein E [Deltaproteobacteria bacterium]
MSATLESVFAQTLALYLKPVQIFVDDPSVSEILINGADEIYVERQGRLYPTDAKFEHEDHVHALAKNIAQYVGRILDEDHPLIDARLPGGSRVHITLPPVSRKGVCIAIRKFFREALTVQKLIDLKSINEHAAEFLDLCVKAELNMVVAGGTGSGKTSLLNVLSSMVPEDQRIIVLEESTELQLQQPHLLQYETRPPDRMGKGEINVRQLFRSAMRMRPDRVIIGEVRGGEALDMVQAMVSGHKGSMSTTHASTPRETLARLETLSLMGDVDIPLYALRSQISLALEIIVQIARYNDGSRKVTQISEVLDLDDNDKYQIRDLFKYEVTGRTEDGTILGDLNPTGLLPTFADQMKVLGLRFPKAMVDAAKTRKARQTKRKSAGENDEG